MNSPPINFAQGPQGPSLMARPVQNIQPFSVETAAQEQIFRNLQLQSNQKPGSGPSGPNE